MNAFARTCAYCVAALLVLGTGSLAQESELPVIPPERKSAGLTDEDKSAVDKYVKYWTEAIGSANSAEQVVQARRRLGEGFDSGGTQGVAFKDYYVERVAVHAKTLLSAKIPATDPRKLLKEVNLSMAVLRMPQMPIQPLVEAMVAHENPAVRYFGWSSFARLRGPMLSEGLSTVQKLYPLLTKAAADESDRYVLGVVIGVLRLPPRPANVDETDYQELRKKFLAILQAHWTKRCRQVLAGDAAASEPLRAGVTVVGSLTQALGGSAERKASLQMVMNMAWSAAKTFDMTEQLGQVMKAAQKAIQQADDPTATEADKAAAKAAVAKIKEHAAKLGRASADVSDILAAYDQSLTDLTLLLLKCEEVLNTLTKKSEADRPLSYIEKPLLRSSTPGQRGAELRLGVMKWTDKLVKEHGLKRPDQVVPAPAPTPAPKTKPAPAPKTKPATAPAAGG